MVNQDMKRLGAMRSCIRELFEYGLRRKAIVGAENVFDYSLGNPSIPAPAKVGEAICEAVRTESSLSLHGYTPAVGCAELREAVAADLNRRFDAHVRPQNLFFTCGAAPGLIAVMRALSAPEAEIIAIAPHFPEYRPFAENNGCRLTVVSADEKNFQIDFDALAAAINPHTQAVIVNSPNNPSGAVYSEETLRRLAALLTERGEAYGKPIYIIADEPYRELVYGGVKVPFIPNLYKNTIVCYSWSKSLSLPGERIGYVLVPDAADESEEVFAAVMGAARATGHVCTPSLIQHAVARCLDCEPDLEAYDRNRRLLFDRLTAMGYSMAKPDGAFYLFIKAPGGDCAAFCEAAKQRDLLLVPGDDFGCAGYFRICYCVEETMILRSLPVFEQLIREFR